MGNQTFLEKTFLAGIGLCSMTKDKAQALVGDLVKKGELAQEEGPNFVKTVMQKAEEEVDALKKMVDTRVQQTLAAIRPNYDDEFKKLNKRIDKLSKDVEKINKK